MTATDDTTHTAQNSVEMTDTQMSNHNTLPICILYSVETTKIKHTNIFSDR